MPRIRFSTIIDGDLLNRAKGDNRVLTVSGFSPSFRKEYPFIRLQGKWLESLGFQIGSRITVEEKQGELVLRVISYEKQ